MDDLLEKGMQLHQSKKLSEAETIYRNVLEIDPRNSLALLYLGMIARESGHLLDSRRLVKKAKSIDPSNPEIENQLGIIARIAKQTKEAIRHFRYALELDSKYAPAASNLANIYFEQSKFESARKLSREILRQNPEHKNSLTILAQSFFQDKRYEKAIKYHERIKFFFPFDIQNLLNLGAAYGKNRESLKAKKTYKHIIGIEPNSVKALHGLATTLSEAGEMDKAIKYYKRTVEVDPSHLLSWTALVESGNSFIDASKISELTSLSSNGRLSLSESIKLYFCIAKYWDRKGQFNLAFENYRLGNQLRQKDFQRKGIEYDPLKQEAIVDEIKETYSANYFLTNGVSGSPSDIPVFIVGMPRSGTTLTDQILAMHPKITSIGEDESLQAIIGGRWPKVAENKQYWRIANYITPTDANAIATEYLSRFDTKKISRVVNKLPFNFHLVGLLKLIFPNAYFVACKRLIKDTVISCFLQNFIDNHPWSVELSNIIHYHQCHDALMEHWYTLIPEQILEANYERIVANSRDETRNILSFLGLSWDERCLKFYQSRSVVQTASKWQVRKPIYKTSINRWKNYDNYLPSEIWP